MKRGHIDVIRFGLAHGLKLTPVFYSVAINNGHSEVRALLEEHDCPITDTALIAAVSQRDRPLILTLKAKGFPLTVQASDMAVELSDLGLLKWYFSLNI